MSHKLIALFYNVHFTNDTLLSEPFMEMMEKTCTAPLGGTARLL